MWPLGMKHENMFSYFLSSKAEETILSISQGIYFSASFEHIKK